jgi:hypothetical protein
MFDTAWHHWAVTFPLGATDIAAAQFYLDGVAIASTGNTANLETTVGSDGAVIGALPLAGDPSGGFLHMNGAIDDVRVYSRALSAAAITQLYAYNGSTSTVPAPTATPGTGVAAFGFTANWNPSSGAEGYRIDVATDVSFTNFVAGFQNLDVANATAAAVSSLAANTVYYYRLRAYNSTLASDSSNTITVITTSSVVGTPTAIVATGITSSYFTANWNVVPGATTYRLDISTSSGFAGGSFVNGYHDLDIGNQLHFTATALPASTTFYYRIRAVSGLETGAVSNVISVTTGPSSGNQPQLNIHLPL